MTDPATPPPNLDVLFAAARVDRRDTSLHEYAFETRLLARLRERPAPLVTSTWAQATWRMIPLLSLSVLVLAVWEARVSDSAREAQQIAFLENPEAGDLIASFD